MSEVQEWTVQRSPKNLGFAARTEVRTVQAMLLLFAPVFLMVLSGCRAHPAAPTDQALMESVQSRIASDSALAGQPIQVSAVSGIVTLNGIAANDASRSLASDDAAQIAGVKTVINNLTVQTASHDAQVSATMNDRPAHPSATPERHSGTMVGSSSLPTAHLQNRSATDSRKTLASSTMPQPQSSDLQPKNSANASQPLPTQPPAPIVRAASTAVAPPAMTPRTITLPSGTAVAVRMSQTLDSATTQPDDVFKGIVASDVLVDGITVLRQGTPVLGRVVTVQEAAHFKGDSLLTITLTEIDRNNVPLKVATDTFSKAGKGRGKNTVEKVGGGAAIGALLGGLFGGGTGAAIGALAGGGAGAGVNAATRGQQVQIPSETIVPFKLAKPLAVVVTPGATGSQAAEGLHRRPEGRTTTAPNQ